MVGSDKVKNLLKKKFPSLSSLGSDGNTSFLRAARAGHLDKVLEQLRNNVDINTCNANGLNALHLASKDGHVHVVTELLKRGANVDSATKKGNTALHIASLAGQEEVVRLLVEHGASVNVQSQNGFTPLYMAAQENHDNVVKYLLSNGANQSLATEDGFTPLAVAMQQGHDKVVAVLLENDTRGKVRLPALHIAAKKDDCKAAALLLQNEHNPDVTSKSGFTPLHIASHYGNEGIANLLLNKGADVNYAAKHNITPLHVAAKWGKSNMVSLLLEKGANIESKTRDGLTPLHCAARSGHEQVVDMLLERGAPISSKTKNGLAPLHMASQGDHVDAARILLYHRAPVDEVTVDYLTALHVAAHCGHARVAKLLLDRKADPNARALNGFTPLHIACKKNRIKVVELLLKHGASIEATTESGLTPLHVASFMGCMNIVIYLLQNEASPDVPTVRGETPLHLAARANQTDIIRILLRNGAQVDARAREQQTPLHIAARLGNVDIVMLLLQHGAAVDCATKDLYSALHIAAKEGQDEVAAVLLENGASVTATTKKGFTPLHLAAKYGNMKVARLLLQRDAPVDAQGKNGVTPLHVASHYDHQNVALLLLDKGASPHATAKNGHTPLHIAAKKNQMDIATTLLEYGAKANAESKAGFTPLHLSSQEGHVDMSSLLIDHHADTNHKAKNGLTPLHLCAQEDRVNVASILVKNSAEVDSTTKAGYTPLHVACHFGQLGMVKFLLDSAARADATTAVGYTPLHQAAQQGHCAIVNTLLEHGAPPNATTNQGQTAMSIAQKLGYISVVETLKGVTEPATITPLGEEKYKVVSPETMQETFMSDSEDEGGEDTLLSEQPYRYLTVDEMKSLGDDSLPIDVRQDERLDSNRECMSVPPTAVDDTVSPQHYKEAYSQFTAPDNVDIAKHPLHVGFLVSFLVDARGGAMRGCRHSGVRVIVPPRRASMPMRVTCRYLRRDKLTHPPPLMEGEALASRILELGPVGAKFLGPVMIEVPHFGSLRGKEREIVILRSDNGETWREHTVDCSEEAVQDVLGHSFDKEDLAQLDESSRTTRILTTDFPHYFAVVTRVRQEVHAIGPEGGMVSSSVVPQVQAVFPQGALTKKIKVGLQAQPIPAELAAKLLGNRVAVSPIVTVEPRRRKFHKPITLTIPKPQAANKGMINQYSGDAPTLRLLCSITGGTTRAQWEDVTGSTPFTFVNDCVSFTTTVSARFWLMDCRNVGDATKMATELYREAIHVPFMAKFVVFAKRVDPLEARLRIFCMTDDKEDKTLEHQEHFTEVAKSRDVEVLEGKTQYVEFAGNLVPVTKSGEQLQLGFRAFRENRLPFTARVKDPHADSVGRTLFMREARLPKGEPPQQPICVLNIVLPDEIIPEAPLSEHELHKYSFIQDSRGLESYQRVDLRLSDVSNLLGEDWVSLAHELAVSPSDINKLKTEHPQSSAQQGLAMLRLWLTQAGNKAQASTLETALQKIGRDDIVQQCVFNVDHSAVQLLKDESRDASLRRSIPYSDKDIMKDPESVEDLSRTQLRKKRDFAEKDDKEEKKYEAEEKEIDEVKKSVSERRKEIEKRLSLEKPIPHKTETIIETIGTEKIEDVSEKEISEEKRVSSPEEEPSELSFEQKRLSFEQGKRVIEMKPDKTTMKEVKERADERFLAEERKAAEALQEKKALVDETSIPFEEKRKSFEKSEKEEKVKEEKVKEKKEETKKEELRRDSALFEGVSQGLVRLDAAFTAAPQVQDLLSPKASKTPPPSPAEFKDLTGTVAWTEDTTSAVIPSKVDQSQDWAEKGQPDSAIDASNKEHPIDSVRTTQQVQPTNNTADYSSPDNINPKFSETINIETHDHLADKIKEKEAKYQFTMTVPNKESFTEMANTLTTFLDNEKEYNELLALSNPNEVTASANTEVQSSDETEENLSKSESDPKSDKSFVGKMSQKLFGVFKKDEKGKPKKKKEKNRKNKSETKKKEKEVDLSHQIPGTKSFNEPVKENINKEIEVDINSPSLNTTKESGGFKDGSANCIEPFGKNIIDKMDDISKVTVDVSLMTPSAKSEQENNGTTTLQQTTVELLNEEKGSITGSLVKNIKLTETTSIQEHGEKANLHHTDVTPPQLTETNLILKDKSDDIKESLLCLTEPLQETDTYKKLAAVTPEESAVNVVEAEGFHVKGVQLDQDKPGEINPKLNRNQTNEISNYAKSTEHKTDIPIQAVGNTTDLNEAISEISASPIKEICSIIDQSVKDVQNEIIKVEKRSNTAKDKTVSFAGEKLSETKIVLKDKSDDVKESIQRLTEPLQETDSYKNSAAITSDHTVQKSLTEEESGLDGKDNRAKTVLEPSKTTNQKIKSFFGGLFGKSNETNDSEITHPISSENCNKALKEVTDAIEKETNKYMRDLDCFKGELTDNVEQSISPDANSLLPELGKAVHKPNLIAESSGSYDAAVELVDTISTKTVDTANKLQSDLENVVEKGIKRKSETLDSLQSNSTELPESIKDEISSNKLKVENVVEKTIKSAKDSGISLTNKALEDGKKAVRDERDDFKEKTNDILNKSVSGISSVTNQLQSAVENVVEKGIKSETLDSLQSTSTELPGSIKNEISSSKIKVENVLKTSIKSAKDSGTSFTNKALKNSQKAVHDKSDDLKEKTNEILDKTISEISSATNQLQSAVENVVEKGMKSKSETQDSLQSTSTDLSGSIKDGISSSKIKVENLIETSINSAKDSGTSFINKSLEHSQKAVRDPSEDVKEKTNEMLNKNISRISSVTSQRSVENTVVEKGMKSKNETQDSLQSTSTELSGSIKNEISSSKIKVENLIENSIKSAKDSGISLTNEALEGSVKAVRDESDGFKEKANEILNKSVSGISSATNQLQSAVENVVEKGIKSETLDSLQSTSTELPGSIKNEISSSTIKIENFLQESIKSAKDSGISLTNKALGGREKSVQDKADDFKEKTNEILNKSISGISSATNQLQSAVENEVEKGFESKSDTLDSLQSTSAESSGSMKDEISSSKIKVENAIEKLIKSDKDSGSSFTSKVLENNKKPVHDQNVHFKEKTNEILNKNISGISSNILNVQGKETQEDVRKSTESNDEKLNNMLIDMLIEQECMNIPSEDTSPGSKEQPEISTSSDKYNDQIPDKPPEMSELRTVHSFGKIESLISESDVNTVEKEVPSKSEQPYVTTPTMQRRKIGGSQRLSREERPTLREIRVSRLSDYSSSDEETCNRYIVTEPTDQSSTRKVSFHVESEDEHFLKVSDSNSEPEVDVTEMTPSPVPTFDEEAQEVRLEDSSKQSDNKHILADGHKNSKKVEQRFERMASETMEADPLVKFTADKEFQRMVSQLSAEEVDACISQWDEGGLTPSEEQDSSNTTVEGELGSEIEALPEAIISSTNPFYSQSSQWIEFEHGISNIPSSIFWAFDSAPPSGAIQPSELDIPVKSKKIKGETTGEEAEGTSPAGTTRETDEALLDLAAGLKDNTGSSASGVGPSTK